MRQTRTILTVAALGAGLAFGNHALAAPDLSAGDARELCNKLDEQYKFVIQFKDGMPYADEAKALHKEGVAACDGGEPAKGVADLRQSLRTMYVKPEAL